VSANLNGRVFFTKEVIKRTFKIILIKPFGGFYVKPSLPRLGGDIEVLARIPDGTIFFPLNRRKNGDFFRTSGSIEPLVNNPPEDSFP